LVNTEFEENKAARENSVEVTEAKSTAEQAQGI